MAGDGRTGRMARFSQAAVHVVFQTRPGPGDDKLIQNGGVATLALHSGVNAIVHPQDGIYHFDLPQGEDAVLTIFSTQFLVKRVAGTDPDPSGTTTLVAWSGTLRPIDGLEGVLQRLQILGYFTGAVSGTMDDVSERAILEFQADNGLVIDGEAARNTRDKLSQVFGRSGMLSGTDQPLLRRYLAFFGRAANGATRRENPQFDFRGGGPPKLALGVEATAPGAAPPQYHLGVFPRNLDDSSLPWVAAMRRGGVISLSQSAINAFSDRLTFSPVAQGNDVMEIHQGAPAGPVIATLEVQVVPMKVVNLWGHLLTVRQTGTGATLADPPNWTREEAQSLMDRINDIWNPMGIRFVFVDFEEHDVDQPQAGAIVDDFITHQVNYQAIARRFNRHGKINVYFTQKLTQISLNADNQREEINPTAYAGNRWDYDPSCVFTSKTESLPNLARALAHEFGHMHRLTAMEYAHSDDRGVAQPFRFDIWSRIRMMAKYLNYPNTAWSDRSWQDTTYGTWDDGTMRAGDLITVKNFSNDPSDGEMDRARASADSSGARTGR